MCLLKDAGLKTVVCLLLFVGVLYMTQLEQEMVVLRRLFEPWNTAPSGTVIWKPEDSDSNGQFKRSIIDKAFEVIVAGDSALAGGNIKLPEFGDSEYDAIAETLGHDHQQNAFNELALACVRVVQSLHRVTT